ncbi:MAG: glycosyltransferase [Candidatus Scalindua sp.]
MKIVMVSNHACVRMHKMALPLIEGGVHDIHLLANRQTSFSECYTTFGHWLEISQLAAFIKLHAKDTDVFHVHNEPSWFVTLIKEICDVPVVLDIHDSFLARVTPEQQEEVQNSGKTLVRITAEERNNFQLADALVFPSSSFADLVASEFGLQQPSIILPSYMPRRMYRYNIQDWLGGLVYEGKVQVNCDSRVNWGFRYCNYEKLAHKCNDIGMDFHIYGGRNDKEFMSIYNNTAFVHEPYVFDQLIKNIARHDWGLVGNIMPTSEWNIAMPNKLFEYIAAGVPIVSINADTCSKYIEKHGIGIKVESMEELATRWSEHRETRKNLLKTRVKFSMEENIDELINLYAKVV